METFDLTIRMEDYNSASQRPEFMKQLRNLTLYPSSGMNCELNSFERIQKERPVNAHVITAYHNDAMIGWALLSKERSEFPFMNSDFFNPEDGFLFEVYVDWNYRKKGVATQLFKVAKRFAREETLCVCPHDVPSEGFYRKLSDYNNKHL